MRRCIGMLFAVASFLVVACASVEQTQFSSESGKVWPPSPEPTRIRFIMEFSGPADLGIKPSFWARLVGIAAGPGGQGMVRPMAVAATPDGQVIFVADPDAQCVHRFDLRRSRYDCLVAETGVALMSPVGLAVTDDGRLFVADSALDLVLVAGPKEDTLRPLALSPSPEQPTGLAISSSGELFIASTASHSVGRYDAGGKLVREYGGRGSEPGQMNYPTYLWLVSPNELLVTDTMNFRVQRFDIDGGVLGSFGEVGDGTGSFARPKGITADRHGHIYVVDGSHHAMQVFDQDGKLLLAVGEQGQGAGEFWLPSGIFATADDLIFIADAYNSRVQVFRYEVDGS